MNSFLPLGVAFLIIALPAESVEAAETDPYLPRETRLVACIQVRQLRDAAVVKRYLGEGLTKIVESRRGPGSLCKILGIDPLRDIECVTLAGPATFERGALLLIVHGRFDRAKIDARLADLAKREPETYQAQPHGQRLLHQYKGPAGAVPLFFSFLDQQTLVLAAARRPVMEVLERKADEGSAISKELADVLAKIDAQATAWLAAVPAPELKKQLAPTPDYQRFVNSVQNLRGSIYLNNGIQAAFLIQTNDARAAVEIRKFMEGIKSILILAAVNQNKKHGAIWGDLLGLLKVASVGETVMIKGQATAEQIAQSVAANGKPKKE